MFRLVINDDHLSAITMVVQLIRTPHVGDTIVIERVGPIVVQHVGSAVADGLDGIVIAARA
jgi:hypothetical protein